MIIGRDFIYLHIPKTAGSSFEKMMKSRHGLDVFNQQHNSARDIPLMHRNKFIFGFLRDPLLAEVSNWRYHFFSWGSKEMTFERWCEWRFGDVGPEYGNRLNLTPEQYAYGRIFNVRPSAGYFCDEEGRCIADNIYRFEKLGEALEDLSDRLGLNCKLDGFSGMQYGWSRGREDYTQHVTPLSLQLLTKAKAIDFELHAGDGPINTDFLVPTVKNYGYSR